MMYLVAIAWIYVVLMMALAEALSPQGTVLGALFTVLLYGALPLSIVLYLLGTPARRRARHRAEQATAAGAALAGGEPPSGGQPGPSPSAGLEPDQPGHAAAAALSPKREEP